MEQVKKVAELNENPVENEEKVKNVDADGGGERDDIEISYMDELPNEILMKILDYLDEQQLVKCRLLASRWNEICCLLLQDKAKNNSESRLVVQLREDMKCQIVITKSLAKFLKRFGPSEAEKSSGCRRSFPFSSFFVSGLTTMNMTKMCEFVSTFGPRMKTVFIHIKRQDISNFQRFWKLLLHFAPSIQYLKLSGDSSLKDVILFDPINKFIAESDPNFKVVNPNDTFLKNLKVLKINSEDFGQFNEFMKELLDNAPNLEQVLSSDRNDSLEDVSELEHLAVWQQLNKAHLLKNLDIKSDSRSNLSPVVLMKNLRLVNLRADCSTHFSSKDVENSIINYINHALKSSGDTLSSLDLDRLSVENMKLCLKDIKSLPNLRKLKIRILDPIEYGNFLEKLSQICPNIKILDLLLLGNHFVQVARVLWTEFKGLKSLKFSFYMGNDGRRYHLTLDSAISGYSKESIQKIQTKLNEGISLEEARRGEPQNPSISNLLGLRELEVGFFEMMNQGHNLEDKVENSLFFKLLPQLHTKKVWVRNYREVFSVGFTSYSSSDSDE